MMADVTVQVDYGGTVLGGHTAESNAASNVTVLKLALYIYII
jgi:hypothetical protein